METELDTQLQILQELIMKKLQEDVILEKDIQ